MVLEKILGSPLDSKEIQPVNLKRHQPWIFIGSSDAEAEALKLWPSDVKSRLLGKDSNGRKDWGWKEKWGDRGWDGWMASLAQWTCVWANSGRWWRTGKPGVLLSVGSQRDTTEQLNNDNASLRDRLSLSIGKTPIHCDSQLFVWFFPGC